MPSIAPVPTRHVIGIDAHAETFTFTHLDPNLQHLDSGTLPNTEKGYRKLLERVPSTSEFAIENAFAHALPLTHHLITSGARVYDVPAFDVAQLRRRRNRGKNDTIDAEHVALVHARHATLRAPVKLNNERLQIRSVSRTRERLVTQRVALEASMKALPEFTPAAVRQAMLSVVTVLKEQIRALEKELRTLVGPYHVVLEQVGIGLVSAAVLIAETQHASRFRSEAAFASYAGVAPRDYSSGRSSRVRVNPGGNRRLNRAIEIITWTRLRLEERTQAYYRRKRAEGMGARRAVRATKRVVCKEVFGVLEGVLT
jgi:transposase